MTREDLKEIESEGVYEFIASNYWGMTREDLKTLSLEIIYQLEQTRGNLEQANKNLVEVLKEEVED